MKKVLAVALLCAVSSFASWNMFPVKPAGKGEAKLGFQYDMPAEKHSKIGLNLGGRFSVIENLELALMMQGGPGFLISETINDKDTDRNGFDRPVIGVRYFLPMGVAFFADFYLPISSEDNYRDPKLGLKLGAQYTTKLTGELDFGSEAAIYNIIEEGAELDMSLAAEVDYNLGAAIPLLNVKLEDVLSDYLKLVVKPGVKVPVGEMIIVDAVAGFCVAGEGCGDDIGMSFGANVGVHF